MAAINVFPEPRELRAAGSAFKIDDGVSIVVPSHLRDADQRLAHLLIAEISSRNGFAIHEEVLSHLPAGGRFILIGAFDNSLVKEYCATHNLKVSPTDPGPEGYILDVTSHAVVIAGSDERGSFYGLQTLRQLIETDRDGMHIPGVKIRDWPYSRFRAIKLFLPGRDHIGYFKRFTRDYMALYKYNRLLIEMNGAMRLDRHPEINAGTLDLARDMQLRRLLDPPGLWFHGVNASHYDVADRGILEKRRSR